MKLMCSLVYIPWRDADIRGDACVRIHTYSASLCLLRGPGDNDIPGASSTPSAQVLVSKFWNKVSSEKWLIPVLGQGKCKKRLLEHLVLPEGKEILTKTKGWSHGNQSERPPSDQS